MPADTPSPLPMSSRNARRDGVPELPPVVSDRTDWPQIERYMRSRGMDRELEELRVRHGVGTKKAGLLRNVDDKDVGKATATETKEALGRVEANIGQIEKKERFWTKVWKFPLRHPIITSLAGAAALYFGGGALLAYARDKDILGAGVSDGWLNRFGRSIKCLRKGAGPAKNGGGSDLQGYESKDIGEG